MYVGIDIGGTKCAVLLGNNEMKILSKVRFDTLDVQSTLDKIYEETGKLCAQYPIEAIGISCGSPLDDKKGIIQSPPNLPGWDDIHITEEMEKRFHVPAFLCNDANACALAEWKYGAGKGTENMIFLTFGTGMGAGLILNGRLYSGSTGYAGEAGHMRLASVGPVGYGKAGSFEGFCSGGGLKQLGQMIARQHLQVGEKLAWCEDLSKLDEINAKILADFYRQGDSAAREVFELCGAYLGKGLSILMDLFDPDAIVIGSIFERCEDIFRPLIQKVIDREVLPSIRSHCRILPALLGDQIGDIAALSIAAVQSEKEACGSGRCDENEKI